MPSLPSLATRTGRISAVAGIVLAGVIVVAPVADAATTKTVTMTDSQMFMPRSITITHGTVVKWKNTSFTSHTVKSNAGTWGSGVIRPGGVYTRTFTKVGTFRYHCTIHPDMTGTITVK